MIAIDSLSLREKAAQLLFPRLGSNMQPPITAAEDAVRFSGLLEECPVGGLLVFNGRYPETADALAALQRSSRIPLLVAADMERGAGQQIDGATVFPHAMAYGAMGEEGERLLEESARVQAREALKTGIHVTFSPVADVNRDPRNPIIATRAFSSDPEAAARLARAFIRGCRSEGLLTTAKHFPGHGNTDRDSHAEIPIVSSNREELETFDLVPFRAAVDAGVDLVMSAHVVYPAFDADRPATLSATLLRRLLRDEIGFEGAVVTDSLLMGAIRTSHPNPGEQAAALVRAGVDILLDVPDPVAAAEGIARAVEGGQLEPALLDAALGRVLVLKRRTVERFGRRVFTAPRVVFEDVHVGSASAAALAAEAARRAVTVIDDRGGCIPQKPEGSDDVAALLLKPHGSRLEPDEEPFGRFIRDAFPGIRFLQLGPQADRRVYREALELAAGARLVVAVLVVKPAAWHAFGLLPEQDELVRRIVYQKPTIVASLGSPYVLDRYADAAARVCTFSDVEASQRALAERLAGRHMETPADGSGVS